jgi:hypothetical protein
VGVSKAKVRDTIVLKWEQTEIQVLSPGAGISKSGIKSFQANICRLSVLRLNSGSVE